MSVKEGYDYIIVGTGLCGLVLAKDLVKKNKKVLILERGGFLNNIGSVFNAFFYYDKHALQKSKQGIIIYRTFGVGGTSIVSCGNAVTPSREEILNTGIDFTQEIDVAKEESFVRDNGLIIGKASRRIMDEANKLGYSMVPMPKFSITGKCVACGNCYLGCDYDSKWTSRQCLKDMPKEKYDLVTNFKVSKVLSENGKAVGVEGEGCFKKAKFFADKVILTAGGLGTPVILQNSGLSAGNNFYADLYNVTYGLSKEYNQRKELTMSAVCGKFHASDGFVFAPFVDNFYSFTTGVEAKDIFKLPKLNRMMGIMVKIADDNVGRVYKDGSIDKEASQKDLNKLNKGTKIVKEILNKCGVLEKDIFVSTIKGAHPGGTAAIGHVVDKNLETQMKGLYVCDASVIPNAPGLPPILMLIALSKWFAKRL